MAGRTGKRAKPPGKCIKCGNPIRDTEFLRERKGDTHICCPPLKDIGVSQFLRQMREAAKSKEGK